MCAEPPKVAANNPRPAAANRPEKPASCTRRSPTPAEQAAIIAEQHADRDTEYAEVVDRRRMVFVHPHLWLSVQACRGRRSRANAWSGGSEEGGSVYGGGGCGGGDDLDGAGAEDGGREVRDHARRCGGCQRDVADLDVGMVDVDSALAGAVDRDDRDALGCLGGLGQIG